MEPIEILSCVVCSRVVDQWTMIPKCKRCGMNRFKQIAPTKWAIIQWFISEPKHVIKLLIQDLREKYEARG